MNTRSNLGIFLHLGQKKGLEVPCRVTNPRNSCRHHDIPPAVIGADPRRPKFVAQLTRFGWDHGLEGRLDPAPPFRAVGFGVLVSHFNFAKFQCGLYGK